LFDSKVPLAVAVRALKWPLLTASLFQKKKLIGYSQKDKRIFDGAGLASVSCQRYMAIKDEYDNFPN
jgi:hypothetical protein